jgi:hypothetical protein
MSDQTCTPPFQCHVQNFQSQTFTHHHHLTVGWYTFLCQALSKPKQRKFIQFPRIIEKKRKVMTILASNFLLIQLLTPPPSSLMVRFFLSQTQKGKTNSNSFFSYELSTRKLNSPTKHSQPAGFWFHLRLIWWLYFLRSTTYVLLAAIGRGADDAHVATWELSAPTAPRSTRPLL